VDLLLLQKANPTAFKR